MTSGTAAAPTDTSGKADTTRPTGSPDKAPVEQQVAQRPDCADECDDHSQNDASLAP